MSVLQTVFHLISSGWGRPTQEGKLCWSFMQHAWLRSLSCSQVRSQHAPGSSLLEKWHWCLGPLCSGVFDFYFCLTRCFFSAGVLQSGSVLHPLSPYLAMKTQVEKYLSYILCQDSDQVKAPSVSKVSMLYEAEQFLMKGHYLLTMFFRT